MNPLSVIVVLFGIYALLGLVIGALYLAKSAPTRDEALRDSPVHVRLLLLPGCIAVWPLLLSRLRGARERSS